MKSTTRTILALAATSLLTACVAEPEPTTFVLTNGGDVQIYHDAQPSWLSLQVNGDRADLNRPGCMAKCGALRGQVHCDDGAASPAVVELQPGDESVVDWDGIYYLIDEDRSCYRERQNAGELQARFCYDYDYEGFGEEPTHSDNQIAGAWVSDPVCELQPFERGGTVELRAE